METKRVGMDSTEPKRFIVRNLMTKRRRLSLRPVIITNMCDNLSCVFAYHGISVGFGPDRELTTTDVQRFKRPRSMSGRSDEIKECRHWAIHCLLVPRALLFCAWDTCSHGRHAAAHAIRPMVGHDKTCLFACDCVDRERLRFSAKFSIEFEIFVRELIISKLIGIRWVWDKETTNY